MDISDRKLPRKVNEVVLGSPPNIFCVSVNYRNCFYVVYDRGLGTYSLEDPHAPELLHSIDSEQLEFHASDDRFRIPNRISLFEDKLICHVPHNVMIFDLVDPENPAMISARTIVDRDSGHNYNDDKAGICAIAFSEGHLYCSSRGGLTVYRLEMLPSGRYDLKEVGKRSATPLEQLAMRWPRGLFRHQDLLIENAGPFGVLAYDITDPTRPRRKYHATTSRWVQKVGLYRQMLYTLSGPQGGPELNLFEIPDK